MTLYTYECPKCGRFEEWREKNDRKICICGEKVKKVYGGAFKLIGNGYYSTDTAKANNL